MDEKDRNELRKAQADWETKCLAPFQKANPERLSRYSTVSDLEILPLYGPAESFPDTFLADIGFPGQYPYTRGVQPNMYRGRFWTMRPPSSAPPHRTGYISCTHRTERRWTI